MNHRGSNVTRSCTRVTSSVTGVSVRSCCQDRMLSMVDFSWNDRPGSSATRLRWS